MNRYAQMISELKTPEVMKKVTVETFGVDYPEPEKV